jgi:hypothetical protein
MVVSREQFLSYGVSAATGSLGAIAKKSSEQEMTWAAQFAADAGSWTAMEQVTVACMALGALGIVVRIYVDVLSAVRARRGS